MSAPILTNNSRLLAAASVIGRQERLKPTGRRAMQTAQMALDAADLHDDRISIEVEDAAELVLVAKAAATMLDSYSSPNASRLRRIADELYDQIGRTA